MFKTGDKVICIEDCNGKTVGGNPSTPASRIPKKGDLLVVRGVYVCNDLMGLHFTGIHGGHFLRSGNECSWISHKFRKLEEIRAENQAKKKAMHPV